MIGGGGWHKIHQLASFCSSNAEQLVSATTLLTVEYIVLVSSDELI